MGTFFFHGALLLAAAAVALMALIALNLAQPLVGLERFREPTIAVYVLVAFAFAVVPDRRARAREALARTSAILAHPRFLPAAAGVMLALYLLAPLTRHLAFQTSAFDFSMIDEAIWQSSHGRFLYTPVLERSLLSEHFSPILALLVPWHALLPSPYLLLVVHALVLWGAGLVVRRLVLDTGWSVAVANLAFVAWLHHPMLLSTLEYPVHMEAAYPLLVLGAYLAWRRGRHAVAIGLVVLTLAVKEDAGLYLAGAGAWLAIGAKRPRAGVALAFVGLAWTAVALEVLMPRMEPDIPGFRFLHRWDAWGETPAGILAGFLRQPVAFLGALAGKGPVRLFACLLFLPFLTRRGWLLFVVPWVVNTTSSYGTQNGLGLYYGAPLLAFATVAAIEGSAVFRRRVAGGGGGASVATGLGVVAAVVLVVLNVAHFRYPEFDPDRRAILAAIAELPPGEPVAALSCFWPVLGYERPKQGVHDLSRPGARIVLLRTRSSYPYDPAVVEDAVLRLKAGGWTARFELPGVWILEAEAIRPSRP